MNIVANEGKSNQRDVQVEVVGREVATKTFVPSLCVIIMGAWATKIRAIRPTSVIWMGHAA